MFTVDSHVRDGIGDQYSTCMVRSSRCIHQGAALLSSLISLAMMSPQVAPWWRLLFLIALIPIKVSGNLEGDALNAFRQSLIDSNNVLQSWDPALRNPCVWFHVTCNGENSVTRVDLGNAGLSGTLVPQLGVLTNLQQLELFSNNISGSIPRELGNLTALVSLDLYQNNLTGTIPDSLGQLSNLRFLRLNNNSLTGSIPFSLTSILGLQVMDLSYNNLSGEVPNNGSFSLFSPISFLGNDNLCGSVFDKQCPGLPPFLPPPYTLAPSEISPPMQASKNQKVIILASTISAAILIFLILAFTFIICRNQKHSGDLQKKSKVADVEGRKI